MEHEHDDFDLELYLDFDEDDLYDALDLDRDMFDRRRTKAAKHTADECDQQRENRRDDRRAERYKHARKLNRN